MKTIEEAIVPADAMADLEHAIELQTSGQRDREFEIRLDRQMELIREAIRAAHGVVNVAVDLVREGRNNS